MRASLLCNLSPCLLLVMAFLITGLSICHASADRSDRLCRRVFKLQPDMRGINDLTVPSLTQAVPDADLSDCGLSLEPEEAFKWVLSPGERIVVFAKASRSDSFDNAVLTVWDWEGRPVARTRFTTPFTGRVLVQVDGRGAYVLTLDGVKDDKCRMRLVRSFSVCPPNNDKRKQWSKSNFWIGQCSFPGWQAYEPIKGHFVHPDGLTEDQSMQLDAELVARMGVQIARINLQIDRKDKEGYDLDFSLADKCVKAYTSRGLDLDLQMFGSYPLVYPIKNEPYSYYVKETVRRYGKHARFVQIGNEPGNPQQYSGNASDYLNEYRVAFDEIRRLNTRIPVTNGGYCFTNEIVTGIVKGLRGRTDFVSYHWHGNLPGLKSFWADVSKLHRDSGYKDPIYANTEMGYPMPTVGGERANAVIEMQKLLYCWAHGHKGVLLYSSRELWWPRQYSYDGISDYGFVDHFFCPRFVYGAVSAFIDKYAGYRFERILTETDNLHAYVFRNGSKRIVSVFAAVEPVDIKLRTDAKTVVIVDPMGNEKQIETRPVIAIKAGEYPQSIVVHSADVVEQVL